MIYPDFRFFFLIHKFYKFFQCTCCFWIKDMLNFAGIFFCGVSSSPKCMRKSLSMLYFSLVFLAISIF